MSLIFNVEFYHFSPTRTQSSPHKTVGSSASSSHSFFAPLATTWKTTVSKRSRNSALNAAKRNPEPRVRKSIRKLSLKSALASSAPTRRSKRSWSLKGPANSKIFRLSTCGVSIHKSNYSTRTEMWWRHSASPSGTRTRWKNSSKLIWSPKTSPIIWKLIGFKLLMWFAAFCFRE